MIASPLRLESNLVCPKVSNNVVQLKYYKHNPEELYKQRLKSFEFARNNFLWEKYTHQLCGVHYTPDPKLRIYIGPLMFPIARIL